MDSYARLIEGLPERLAATRSQRGGARATRAALAALPLANPAEAARGLERILDGMLAMAWPGAERIDALECVRVPADALCADVERRIGAESHPLAQASLDWVAAAQRLQWKLACAHVLALHELCAPAGKLPMFKSKLAGTAAVRALLYVDRTLLWSYRRYTAPPPGTWRLAHALAAFTRELGICDQPDDGADAGAAALTARALYAHALLLAMSNPYRFNTRELQQAEQVLACVAGTCDVAAAAPGAPGIAVDPDRDAGPGYIAEDRADTGEGLLVIDASPARQAFDEAVARQPAGAPTIDLHRPGGGVLQTTAAFLDRIAIAWAPASRGHQRLAATHALELVVGMRALHYSLAGNTDFESFLRHIVADAIEADGGVHSAPWRAPADAAPPIVFRGEALDQSTGGYRMRIQAAEGLRLHIGEVVGLAPPVDDGEPRDWMVGLIRWLRHEGEHVFAGIELLSRTARPAATRTRGWHGEPPMSLRAVALDDAANAPDVALLLGGLLARDLETLATLELVLPPAAADWNPSAAIAVMRVQSASALSQDCFRLQLALGVEAGNAALVGC